jgi:hypothetical protein
VLVVVVLIRGLRRIILRRRPGASAKPPARQSVECQVSNDESQPLRFFRRGHVVGVGLVTQLQRGLHRRRGQSTTVYRGRDCAVREQCTTDRQGARPLEVHQPYEPIRRAKERLRSEEGQALYKKRKSTVEAVFGQWQHNGGVRRLRLRGLSGCDIELHLLAIGHNVKKSCKQGVKFNRN